YGRGRPHGSRNRTAIAMETLLDGEGEDIMRKLTKLAKAGNQGALRLCVERLLPPRRERPIKLRFPSIRTAEDISVAQGAVLDAVGRGEVTIGEASQLANLIDLRRKAIEAADFEHRL